MKEELFNKRESGWGNISEETKQNIFKFSDEYIYFLNKVKTEREAISFAQKMLEENGFCNLNQKETLEKGDKVYYINHDKSMYVAVIGKEPLEKGLNVIGAHVDSPRLDLKPNPLYEDNGFAYLKTRYYGGIKKYQWMAMPLSLHGRVVKSDGSYLDIKIGDDENEPCFCITDLLPHLAREQMNKTMSKAILGENLNIVAGSLPLREDDSDNNSIKLNVMRLINEKYGITEEDFISAELEFVPSYKAQDVGFDRSLIGAYGHDDRSCAYPCFKALMEMEIPEETVIVVLVDKEEIGSDGNTGMKSFFLKYFISDLAHQEGLKGRDVLRKSKCISADVNAAFDPTYSGEYEAGNSCYINRGAVITKYTGSGGKSGTSDASAEFMGEIRTVLNKNNVLWQTGQLGKVDSGGGGTIAKYVANLCVDVVDMGIPVLSMHSPFEVISKIDLYMLYKSIISFFK